MNALHGDAIFPGRTEMVRLGGLDMDGYAPKAPAGVIGVVYGEFFPQGGGKDVGSIEYSPYSPYSDNFPPSLGGFKGLLCIVVRNESRVVIKS